MTPSDAKRYHRAVEVAWGRLKGRPGLLSPREFGIVEGWRQRGIPEGLVLEVLEERRRAGAQPRSLAYVTRSIDEAWTAVAAGRAAAPEPRAATPGGPESAWTAGLERSDLSPALRTLLARLLASLREGADATALDVELDETLPRLAPPELVDVAERETAAALAPFRARMSAAELARTRLRARADRLRAALGIPRLG